MFVALALVACERSGLSPDSPEMVDLLDFTPNFGDSSAPPDLASACAEINACGDCEPGCNELVFDPKRGKPFPLSSDVQKDPNVIDGTVARDADGFLAMLPNGG